MPSRLSALLAGSLLAVAAGCVRAQSTCNGYSELCSKLYSNVSYIGAHDSYSVQAGSLAANQNYDVTTQLNNGIRMVQNQVHNKSGTLELCHTSCVLLDAGTAESYLAKVKTWLDANPDEVLTLLWVNSDSMPVADYAQAYVSAGLDSYSYVPSSTPVAYASWPTLQELISSGKRLVSFMDFGADYSVCTYILDHFTHFWETPYDETDPSFPCTVNRGQESTKMYMINHFLNQNLTFFGSSIPVPATSQLNVTNAISGSGSLGLNAQTCAAQYGLYPTFLLVDFYDVGNGSVFQVEANLNAVPYMAVAVGNGTSVSSLTGSSSSQSKSSGSSSGNDASSLTAMALRQTLVPLVLLAVATILLL